MLGIKLKNNDNARKTGCLLVILVTLVFIAMFPQFDKRASEQYEEGWGEGVEDETFASNLIQSNYVLYKDVLDRSGSKKYTYKELYMEEELMNAEATYSDSGMSMVTVTGNDIRGNTQDYSYGEYVDIGRLDSILELYVYQLQNAAENIRSMYVDEIGVRMDYCVLEKGTGTVLKNTASPIEGLALEVQEGGENYVYYVIMDYDAAGNLNRIRAKSGDADRLFKSVQKADSSARGKILPDREMTETFLLFEEETEKVRQVLTISQKKPANATFIYAMTAEQIGMFADGNGGFWTDTLGIPSTEYAYYMAGVDGIYIVLLLAIFVAVILLALFRPERLMGSEPRKASFEAVAAIGIAVFGFGIEASVSIVKCVGNNDMQRWINANFPLNVENGLLYEIVEKGISFVLVGALFGCWYWCCLELSDVTKGVKEYVKGRSLIYRYWSEICGLLKKIYLNFKKELFQVDLGEDMNRYLRRLVIINFVLLTGICLLWGFGIPILVIYTCILYGCLKRYIFKIQLQYGKLLDATNAMAQGRLNNEFNEDFGVFESYKKELYKIQDGFKTAVEEEVKSQHMKTELITNVSHDLKTPLTAIITYIDLLKEDNLTEEQRREYLDTLERKSLRLKVLIEDLFEVSKATSGAIKLEPVAVDICHLMRQVYLEHEEKMQEAGLDVRFRMPEEKIVLQLDSQKTYRIFENLYTNIIKYAMAGTRVFITAERLEGTGGIHIELKNISAQEITGTPQNLTERFVRGDASRNTEGSGLGLAIAKSFTELQGGKFRIETDGDLFKAVLDWM